MMKFIAEELCKMFISKVGEEFFGKDKLIDGERINYNIRRWLKLDEFRRREKDTENTRNNQNVY